MFDIGLLEILLIAVIALLVIGPAHLPHAVMSAIRLLSKVREITSGFQRRIEVELGGEKIEREIHNASIAALLDQHSNDEELKQNRSAHSEQKPAP